MLPCPSCSGDTENPSSGNATLWNIEETIASITVRNSPDSFYEYIDANVYVRLSSLQPGSEAGILWQL